MLYQLALKKSLIRFELSRRYVGVAESAAKYTYGKRNINDFLNAKPY
jgi:hypothetical protein